MKNTIVIRVNWYDEEINNKCLELYYDDETLTGKYITISGCDILADQLISDVSFDIFNEDDLAKIVEYVKRDEMAGDESLLWKKPPFGAFLVVMEVHGWQCNHPLDPEEWDMEMELIGMVGEEVKLVY